jgi:putative ABC transport system permease protein
MQRFAWAQLRYRPTRAATLALGILVAAVSFTLLTSAAQTSRLRVEGEIAKNWETAYDILVRPQGSFTTIERDQGLVRENYLSGIFGGISFSQYRSIRRIHGVEVAAPIANVGYILPFWRIRLPIRDVLTSERDQLYRLRLRWLATNARSHYRDSDLYVYFTRRPLEESGGLVFARVRGKGSREVCPRPFNDSKPPASGPFELIDRTTLLCFSAAAPAASKVLFESPPPRGFVGSEVSVFFPVFVAAVDPEEERRLLRLDRAVVSGRYLRPDDGPHVVRSGSPLDLDARVVPVLATTRLFLDERLEVTVERLRVAPQRDVALALSGNAYAFLASLPGDAVAQRTYSPHPVYERMLTYLSSRLPRATYDAYWSTSPVRYRVLERERLAALPTSNPVDVWTSPFYPEFGGYFPAPVENRDIQFRRLRAHIGSNQIVDNLVNLPSLKVVGRFDPIRLPGFSPLSRVPLETYYPPKAEPADAASRAALGGRPLLPTANLGDYIQQPPLVLTTLKGLGALTNPRFFQGASADAPISVIRVRVASATGPDRLSRERIRQVAQAIHDRTGLAVDITAGSSPHPLLVEIPPGRFGRPALTLREGWVKKGVAVAFLTALDRKSVVLFALILLISAFFLANGTLASVRSRRTEIGTLRCLGWSERKVFEAILVELGVVGLLAGALGIAVAALLASLLSLDMPLARTLFVAPVAVLLAIVTGLIPARRAARTAPLEAVRPPVIGERRGPAARTLARMALVNLLRMPGRALLGSCGLFLGVGALTVLVALNAAFQGALVGTLLGQVISVQVRAIDFVSVALTLVLGGVSIADVLYLNLRERAREIVTLRASGWSEWHVRRLAALEALGMSLAGSVSGAGFGLAFSALLELPLLSALAAAGVAAAAGVGVALVASLVPVVAVTRLTAATVLAGE